MKGSRDGTVPILAPEVRTARPGVLGALRGWWWRAAARLREGYEAQLLEEAESERGRPTDVVRGREPIPYSIRPRPLSYGTSLLRPVFLQFSLPWLALILIGKLAAAGWPDFDGWTILRLGFLIWFETLILNWAGGAMFRQRWDRVRDEAYERWRWRAEAVRAELPASPAPPDERGLPGA